jgi:serine/threonine protein kinase
MLRQAQGNPNIVTLIDSWENEKGTFIAMELMDGDLFEVIQYEKMTPQEVFSAGHDILSGLQHLHSKRLVHFDLKPENIGYTIVDTKKVFKIIDFGSVHSMDQVEKDKFQQEMNEGKRVLTTLHYRPYEAILLNGDKHNQKTDIWSFGCILYEMRKGFQLFEDLRESNSKKENMVILQTDIEMIKKDIAMNIYAEIVVIWMHISLDQSPESRPDAASLLEIYDRDYAKLGLKKV